MKRNTEFAKPDDAAYLLSLAAQNSALTEPAAQALVAIRNQDPFLIEALYDEKSRQRQQAPDNLQIKSEIYALRQITPYHAIARGAKKEADQLSVRRSQARQQTQSDILQTVATVGAAPTALLSGHQAVTRLQHGDLGGAVVSGAFAIAAAGIMINRTSAMIVKKLSPPQQPPSLASDHHRRTPHL